PRLKRFRRKRQTRLPVFQAPVDARRPPRRRWPSPRLQPFARLGRRPSVRHGFVGAYWRRLRRTATPAQRLALVSSSPERPVARRAGISGLGPPKRQPPFRRQRPRLGPPAFGEADAALWRVR